jgi:hypothetical protein
VSNAIFPNGSGDGISEMVDKYYPNLAIIPNESPPLNALK